MEPEDAYSTILEPWGFEDSDIYDYQGMTQTGRSNAFQPGLGAKERVQ